MKQIKFIIKKYSDGYVAYPVGIKGVVVGEGDTYEEALKDVQSALKFHIETFGAGVQDGEAIGQGEVDGCAEDTYRQRACGNRVRVGLSGVSDDSATV